MSYYWGYKPYVSVAQRRATAAKKMVDLAKKGQVITPVKLEGKKIANTFWGKAWCDNLESYSDFANRLPRGRTYVRNGSVVDLQIKEGQVNAIVSGSELYNVQIDIKPLPENTWSSIKHEVGGKIGSLVELLQGRLSQGVMELVTRHDQGLFPNPSEIRMDCSCPDYADMCKHVAAVLYGVGARLDQQPDLLFVLRKVDHMELINEAGTGSLGATSSSTHQTIAAEDLADVFGIDVDTSAVESGPAAPSSKSSSRPKPAASARRQKTLISKTPATLSKANSKTNKTNSKKTKSKGDVQVKQKVRKVGVSK